jgi:hypothetical protein
MALVSWRRLLTVRMSSMRPQQRRLLMSSRQQRSSQLLRRKRSLSQHPHRFQRCHNNLVSVIYTGISE